MVVLSLFLIPLFPLMCVILIDIFRKSWIEEQKNIKSKLFALDKVISIHNEWNIPVEGLEILRYKLRFRAIKVKFNINYFHFVKLVLIAISIALTLALLYETYRYMVNYQ